MKTSLTRREKQILAMLCAGKSNHHIALELNIAQKTVETHLTNLYRKLGVHNRVAAIVAYYKDMEQNETSTGNRGLNGKN